MKDYDFLKKFDLSDRAVLITGASSGIGKDAALLLAKAGAKVFVTARREERLQEVKEEIEAQGGTCEFLVTDVSQEEQCKDSVEACVKAFGRLDILVNNAGFSGSARTLDEHFETERYRSVLATDLDGTFFMTKYAYKECAKGGVGSIINISSLAALGSSGPVAYTAAKGAIKSWTKKFGKEFGSFGVRFNTIYPGLIETEMTARAVNNEEYITPRLKGIPLGRVGQPEDISYCILYLASDAAAYVTGQDFVIDGGNTTSFA